MNDVFYKDVNAMKLLLRENKSVLAVREGDFYRFPIYPVRFD